MNFNYQLVHSKKQNLILLISEFFLLIYELIVCLPLSIKLKFKLKNIKEKRLFILGNGPSLTKDLNKIKNNSQIFAVNTYLSKKYFKGFVANNSSPLFASSLALFKTLTNMFSATKPVL